MQRCNDTSSTELFPVRSQMWSWLMGIPQLQVSISHVATFLGSVWNVLDKAWRRQAAGLHSFKDRFDQIWVTLSHDFTQVSKHLSMVHSELRGTIRCCWGMPIVDVLAPLLCPQRPLVCFKCFFNFHCQKEKQLHFFSLLSGLQTSCKMLTWCHLDSNWESKDMQRHIGPIDYVANQVSLSCGFKMNDSLRPLGALHINLPMSAI